MTQIMERSVLKLPRLAPLATAFAITILAAHSVVHRVAHAQVQEAASYLFRAFSQRAEEEAGDSGDASKAVKQQPRRKSSAQLQQLLRQTFSGSPLALKPPVMVFPVVDPQGKVQANCRGYSRTAAIATFYGPRRRVAASIDSHFAALTSEPLHSPATRFDATTIARCCREASVKMHLLPVLDTTSQPWQLRLQFHGDGDAHPSRTASVEISAAELPRTPEHIAKFLMQCLALPVSQAENTRLQQLALPQRGDDITLGHLQHEIFRDRDTQDLAAGILKRNPQKQAAWDGFYRYALDDKKALAVLNSGISPPPCDYFKLQAAHLLIVSGQAEKAMLQLLPLAATHRGCSTYMFILAQAAAVLEDDAVVEAVLAQWRADDTSYAGEVSRARFLTGWAWQARGDGFASTVTLSGQRKFIARLKRGKASLERALKVNPAGRRAWASMITIDMGLGEPFAVMDAHFRKATASNPRWITPYEHKLYYLTPKWHGSRPEQLKFAQQCLDTKYWDEGIPQLFIQAMIDMGRTAGRPGMDYSIFESPAIWASVKRYYEEAWRYGSRRDRHNALLNYASWGVYGKHYQEVATAHQRIRKGDAFYDLRDRRGGKVMFLGTVVDAETSALAGRTGYGEGAVSQPFSKATVALAWGEPDVAAKQLDLIRMNDRDLDTRSVAAMREAVKISRKLQKQGSVVWTPQLLKKNAVFEAEHFWRISGDSLSCQLPGDMANGFIIPAGFRHGEISGEIDMAGAAPWVMLKMHVNSLREEVAVLYSRRDNSIQLRRNTTVLTQKAKLPQGVIRFRLKWGARQDTLQVAQGIQWESPVHNDEPGCFAIECGSASGQATVRIRNLKFTLRK